MNPALVCVVADKNIEQDGASLRAMTGSWKGAPVPEFLRADGGAGLRAGPGHGGRDRYL